MKKLLFLSVIFLMVGSSLNGIIFKREPFTEEIRAENPDLAARAFDLEEELSQTDTY